MGRHKQIKCDKGHNLVGDNIAPNGGSRMCRICKNDAARHRNTKLRLAKIAKQNETKNL